MCVKGNRFLVYLIHEVVFSMVTGLIEKTAYWRLQKDRTINHGVTGFWINKM